MSRALNFCCFWHSLIAVMIMAVVGPESIIWPRKVDYVNEKFAVLYENLRLAGIYMFKSITVAAAQIFILFSQV